jgi:DNA recombination protein RmuC
MDVNLVVGLVAGAAIAAAAATVVVRRLRPAAADAFAAGHLVGPLQESLQRVDEHLRQLELARREAYAGLTQQVGLLREGHELLRGQTANLVTALRAPATRGRWGELQLRRVVEMAGMVRHCDFAEQPSARTDDGRVRPDLVVHLAGGKHVVVDAKVPMAAYLDALEAGTDVERRARFADHARQVRAHAAQLGAKAYWRQFGPSPEFVVLFVPSDAVLAAALEHDPDLLEHALGRQVLLATPVTLIALLRTVAHTWRQEALADNARAVCELGRELHERLATLGAHMGGVGRSLDRAVDSYNHAVGSLESRVLVSARRFRDLGAADGDLPAPEPVESTTRRVSAAELLADSDADAHVVRLEPGRLRADSGDV